MSEPGASLPIPQRLFTARVLGFAFVASIGMYALLIWILLLNPPPTRPIDQTFRLALWAFALASMLIGPTVVGRVLPRPEPADDHTFSGHLLTRMIVQMACIEAGAIAGLLIFFITMTWHDFGVLAGIAAVLMMTRVPTAVDWENEARARGLSWNLR